MAEGTLYPALYEQRKHIYLGIKRSLRRKLVSAAMYELYVSCLLTECANLP